MLAITDVALRNLPTRPMTREGFFAWAEVQDGQYESDGIGPVAAVGCTNNHGILAGNIRFESKPQLRP